MKRALPALGLTAAGVIALLSYDTRDPVDEVAISGGAVIIAAPPVAVPPAVAGPTEPPVSTPTPEPLPTPTPAPADGDSPGLQQSEPTPTPTPTPTATAEPQTLGDVLVTVEGSLIDTKYGPYQVVATFAEGELVAIEMAQLPTGRKSRGITGGAIPLFTIDALETQSADGVALVSGATVAWEAYRLSLQSALDAIAQTG